MRYEVSVRCSQEVKVIVKEVVQGEGRYRVKGERLQYLVSVRVARNLCS